MTTDSDIRWMKQALQVARRGQGNTAENPAVGCLIVDEAGNLAGVGHTASSGRPHAEPQALQMAGEKANGATAYVTLEPCAHHGKTPPCADALLNAGISRVVIAASDPDPRVSGKGAALLEKAGVEVATGILADEAEFQLRGFFSRIKRARPHVLLKLAVSADGMIANEPGKQTAITGPRFSQYAHLLRARADAILVGAGTIRTDNPVLTCRLPGMQNLSPQRVIVGGDGSLGLAETDWHYPGQVDFVEVLGNLGARGINFLLVEGGAKVAKSLLQADLVDEAVLTVAPQKIGPQGVMALAGMSLAHIAANDRFVEKGRETMGQDVVKHYLRIKRTS